MHIQLSVAVALGVGAAAATNTCGTSGFRHDLRSVSENFRKRDFGVRQEPQEIAIDTYVHIVAANDQVEGGYLTDETVQGEVDLLNQEYAPYGFSFNLIETTRTINESWADQDSGPVGPDTEPELRAALRQGTYKDLNLFFIRSMVPHGRCELPFENPTEEQFIGDGCIMKPIEEASSNPEFGFVTVHEVGHWLGLHHTFENGCEEPGDDVDDTPYEASPVGTTECPEPGRDTCPDQPGLDPTDNYMTYVGDDCGQKIFTPGQTERMHNLYAELREAFVAK